MKKIATVLFTSVLMISLTACSGNKKDATEVAPATTTEEVKAAPAATTNDAEKSLAEYETYVKNFVGIIKKMKDGDTKVIQEYSQYSSQLQQFTADMARYQIDFSPEQMKRWETAQNQLNESLKSLNEKK